MVEKSGGEKKFASCWMERRNQLAGEKKSAGLSTCWLERRNVVAGVVGLSFNREPSVFRCFPLLFFIRVICSLIKREQEIYISLLTPSVWVFYFLAPSLLNNYKKNPMF